ncbi:MAG: outer membrane protein transport protein [Gammaproteobacteria bacterium]|nr:outer membrane protein transport protein [Gammaproteobacteria bacterium]
MRKLINKTQIAVLVSAACLPLAALATNGMNPEGTGTKNRGMAGAGVAMAEETAAIVINPAAVVDVGSRMDVALGLFSPKPRSYTLSGNAAGLSTTQESGDNLFPIPYFGMAFPIDNSSAWAVTLSANGGMNTAYSKNVFPTFPPNATEGSGINLAQLFVSGTYGRKLSPGVALGVSGIYAYQRFEATGLQAFDSSPYTVNPGHITSNGVDSANGFGIKIGVQADLSSDVKLGAAYQSKIKMSKFNKYSGLFADQGELDIAPTTSVGIAWKANGKTTIAFDYLNIDYKSVAAIGNSTNTFSPGVVKFGSSNGPGFGWDSINVFKLGFQYDTSDTMTWRAGWNHGDNPIKSNEVTVNFLAPGVITDHLTLGGTYKMDKVSELSFNYVRSFSHSVSGPFAPTVSAFGGGTMTLEMSQNYVEVGYGKKF